MPQDAIKISTAVSQGYVIAGRPFSLTTNITNPYDQPVEIVTYKYWIPYQVQWIHGLNFDNRFNALREMEWWKRMFARSAVSVSASPPGQEMNYANLQTFGGVIQQIAPGESQSFSFRAIVPQWLFASGGILTFQGVIEYKVQTVSHTSNFEVKFPVRPPLRSMAIGAAVGALLGSFAKVLSRGKVEQSFSNLTELSAATLLAVILAGVAVVYSSRRSNDVQPVLTVEDIWGGLILGFAIGYTGVEYFQKIVPLDIPTNAPAK